MAKDPEFKEANPLVVVIHMRLNGDWIIEPHVDFQEKMKHRRDYDLNKDAIAAAWARRKKPHAPDKPHFLEDPKHIPIVFREWEVLRFVCDPAFTYTASMDSDPNVTIEGPMIPFVGWTGPIMRTPGIYLDAKVKKTEVGTKGPGDQIFYKASAWVIESGIVRVDPDGICDR